MLYQKLNSYFAILFITLIGSVTAYWLVWQSTTIEVEDSLPVAVRHQIFSTPSSNLDTSGWKTYRNEKYGLVVRYPNDWIVRDITRQQGISDNYYNLLVAFNPQTQPIVDNFNIWITDTNKESEFQCSRNSRHGSIFAAGELRMKCLFKLQGDIDDNHYGVYISNGNSLYGLVCTDMKKNGQICDQIVSSLTFTR